MAKYIPSPRDWVREQVELYESSGGTKGTTLRDTGLPVILDAKHSLVAQSLDSPLGAETVNGDGFGIGWYPKGAVAGSE